MPTRARLTVTGLTRLPPRHGPEPGGASGSWNLAQGALQAFSDRRCRVASSNDTEVLPRMRSWVMTKTGLGEPMVSAFRWAGDRLQANFRFAHTA